MNKFTQTYSKIVEKYLWINSFLERATLLKMNLLLGIFEGFYLKVPEDFFDTTPTSIFAVIVNRLCTVFLR